MVLLFMDSGMESYGSTMLHSPEKDVNILTHPDVKFLADLRHPQNPNLTVARS